jgi:hypothetical protein
VEEAFLHYSGAYLCHQKTTQAHAS